MECEILERLAMDRALGELNEDTSALFEAYLAEHPEIQPWVDQMSQTCQRTDQAIRQKTNFGVVATLSLQGRSHRTLPMRLNRWARWAAVIIVSLAIGGLWGRWSGPRYPLLKTVFVAATPKAERQGLARVLSNTGEGFWRDKAVAMLESKTPGATQARNTDGSLWDRYRQLSKERIYE